MDRVSRAKHKFDKRSKGARSDFKEVKDKKLGKGLVKLVRALNQLDTKLNSIHAKVSHIEKFLQ